MQKYIIKKIKKHSKNMHKIAIETFQKMEREKNIDKIITKILSKYKFLFSVKNKYVT